MIFPCVCVVSRVHRWNGPLLGHQVSKKRSHPGRGWGSWQHQQPEGGATRAAYWVSASHTHAAACANHRRIQHTHTTAAVQTWRSPELLSPLFRSVDGRVRRYDLRMGQLHVDFISSEKALYSPVISSSSSGFWTISQFYTCRRPSAKCLLCLEVLVWIYCF